LIYIFCKGRKNHLKFKSPQLNKSHREKWCASRSLRPERGFSPILCDGLSKNLLPIIYGGKREIIEKVQKCKKLTKTDGK
jgi:hypothetical protein